MDNDELNPIEGEGAEVSEETEVESPEMDDEEEGDSFDDEE